jgi:carboxypeptidase C (cathepsin A)
MTWLRRSSPRNSPLEHLGLAEKLQKNIHLQYYDAGHMMYLRDEDLAKLKANIANFIDGASK